MTGKSIPRWEVYIRALQVCRGGPPGEEKWKGYWDRENSRFKGAWESLSVASPATRRKSCDMETGFSREGRWGLPAERGEAGEDLCRKTT